MRVYVYSGEKDKKECLCRALAALAVEVDTAGEESEYEDNASPGHGLFGIGLLLIARHGYAIVTVRVNQRQSISLLSEPAR